MMTHAFGNIRTTPFPGKTFESTTHRAICVSFILQETAAGREKNKR